MKVGFVFTNYNNSIYTITSIESIYACQGSENVSIVIVDNKSDDSDILSLINIKKVYPDIKLILNSENVGYFSGLNIGIEYIRSNVTEISHVVIGNNDLVFPENFIEILEKHRDVFTLYAVISPDLITLDGVHQNPHVTCGISKIREFIWDIYFLNYQVAIVINHIARLTKRFTARKDFEGFATAQPITQGYGACYILGPIFFENFDSLWAPTFLMGEEFFLSEQLKSKNLQLYYDPTFVVEHHDHATMGKLPSKELWEITKQSHKIYRQYVKPFWKLS